MLGMGCVPPENYSIEVECRLKAMELGCFGNRIDVRIIVVSSLSFSFACTLLTDDFDSGQRDHIGMCQWNVGC